MGIWLKKKMNFDTSVVKLGNNAVLSILAL